MKYGRLLSFFFECCLLINLSDNFSRTIHSNATEASYADYWQMVSWMLFDLFMVFFYVSFRKQCPSNSLWLLRYSRYGVVKESIFEKINFHVSMALTTFPCMLWKQDKVISNCSLITHKQFFDTDVMFRCFGLDVVKKLTNFTTTTLYNFSRCWSHFWELQFYDTFSRYLS
jgi:hypothetical protein